MGEALEPWAAHLTQAPATVTALPKRERNKNKTRATNKPYCRAEKADVLISCVGSRLRLSSAPDKGRNGQMFVRWRDEKGSMKTKVRQPILRIPSPPTLNSRSPQRS